MSIAPKTRNALTAHRTTGMLALIAAVALWPAQPRSGAPARAHEELLVTDNEVGHYGGRLVLSLRSEPKTLNPVAAADATTREVIGRMMADLIHINRQSQRTESALAKSWKISPNGRQYTLELRRGLRFSDGHPFDADDVLFTFQVYLDEKVQSPQRDLLQVGGKPIAVQKLDAYTVRFELAQPYAAAERLFDSIAILPRHLLESSYREGKRSAWGLTAAPTEIAGLGPFRLKECVPSQHILLERNPYYWKTDRQGSRLPYLNEILFLFVPSDDAQVIRFQAGETDIISRFSPENFAVLGQQQSARAYQLSDLGPGLEYNFLFFNLNDLSSKPLAEIERKQIWFRDLRFRQAVSAAIDREAIVRLAYRGRATPLWAHVTPGNKLWVNAAIPHPPRSLERARQLLGAAGFSWKADGRLLDARGKPVEFTLVTNSSNALRVTIATIVQDDLRQLGMEVHVVPIEFRALVERLLKTDDYEASVFGIGSGDADPTSEMNVWLSTGSTHLWNLGQSRPATPWEAEIDRLMQRQLTAPNYEERKRLYDQVQELVAENLPIICLVSPNILVGAKLSLRNFRPVILDPYTLWNAEEFFFRREGAAPHP